MIARHQRHTFHRCFAQQRRPPRSCRIDGEVNTCHVSLTVVPLNDHINEDSSITNGFKHFGCDPKMVRTPCIVILAWFSVTEMPVNVRASRASSCKRLTSTSTSALPSRSALICPQVFASSGRLCSWNADGPLLKQCLHQLSQPR